jgi:hypothetical protein
LIFTVPMAGLKAQEPPACDTLVLKNKKVLSVHLDSVKGDVVYYRHCPDDDGRIRSLPLGYLKSIRGTSSVMDTLPKNQDGQVLLKKAPPHTQVWTFSSRDESKPIILSGASEVRIHYKDSQIESDRNIHTQKFRHYKYGVRVYFSTYGSWYYCRVWIYFGFCFFVDGR